MPQPEKGQLSCLAKEKVMRWPQLEPSRQVKILIWQVELRERAKKER